MAGCSLLVHIPMEVMEEAYNSDRTQVKDVNGKLWRMQDLMFRDEYVIRKDSCWEPTHLERAAILDTILRKIPAPFQNSDSVAQVFIREIEECSREDLRELVWDLFTGNA